MTIICVTIFLPHLKEINAFVILSSVFNGYAGFVSHSTVDEYNGLCFIYGAVTSLLNVEEVWFSKQEEQGRHTRLKSTPFKTSFHSLWSLG